MSYCRCIVIFVKNKDGTLADLRDVQFKPGRVEHKFDTTKYDVEANLKTNKSGNYETYIAPGCTDDEIINICNQVNAYAKQQAFISRHEMQDMIIQQNFSQIRKKEAATITKPDFQFWNSNITPTRESDALFSSARKNKYC